MTTNRKGNDMSKFHTVYDKDGNEWRIVERQDVRTLWFDSQKREDDEFVQCASDRSLAAALGYINGTNDETGEGTWSCGCSEYHMADCPVLTSTAYETWSGWEDDMDDVWYGEDDVAEVV